MTWLDDQFLVSGSRDGSLALWRITDDIVDQVLIFMYYSSYCTILFALSTEIRFNINNNIPFRIGNFVRCSIICLFTTFDQKTM